MSSRNRSAAAPTAPAQAAAPSLRTPRRLRRRPVKASGGATSGGRRSGPATPLLKWDVGGAGGPGGGEGRKVGGGGEEEAAAGASAREKAREVSVRKLAAGVWRLRPPEAVAGAAAAAGGAERRVRVGVEHIPKHLQVQLLKQNTLGHHQSLKNEVSSPISVLERKSGELHKVRETTYQTI
ncbi:unnamed protein product [Urochloa humidicola]